MKKLCVIAVVLLNVMSTRAQEEPGGWQQRGGPPPGWGIGIGTFYSTEPYEGFDNEVVPIPFITYFGERLFITGPRAGYRLTGRGDLSCRLLAQYSFTGYEEEDSDVFDGMDDRGGTVEAGLALDVELARQLELEIELVSDVLGRHDGRQCTIEIERSWRKGRWIFAPSVGATWQSSEFVDYYYGVKRSEATPTRPHYVGSDALNWKIDLRINYGYSDRLMFIMMPGLGFLHDEIRDSPIVSEDLLLSGILGCSYRL